MIPIPKKLPDGGSSQATPKGKHQDVEDFPENFNDLYGIEGAKIHDDGSLKATPDRKLLDEEKFLKKSPYMECDLESIDSEASDSDPDVFNGLNGIEGAKLKDDSWLKADEKFLKKSPYLEFDLESIDSEASDSDPDDFNDLSEIEAAKIPDDCSLKAIDKEKFLKKSPDLPCDLESIDCEASDSDPDVSAEEEELVGYDTVESEASDADSDVSNSDVEFGDPKLFQKSYWKAKRFPLFWPRNITYNRDNDIDDDGFFPKGKDRGIPKDAKWANMITECPFFPYKASDPANILAKEAIDLYNKHSGEAYIFKKVVNVNARVILGVIRYITFTAKNTKPSGGGQAPEEYFEAEGYTALTDQLYIEEYGKSKVFFCRPAKMKSN